MSNNDKKNIAKKVIKVYLSYSITGLFFSGVLLFLEERVLFIPHYIATFMNLVVTVPINFILNKFWVYKDKVKVKNYD